MTEAQIENKMLQMVRKRGGAFYKFISPSNPGVPDRILIAPGGRVVFVELKTNIGRLAKIQKWQIANMRELGVDVRVVKGWPEAKSLVDEIFDRELKL